MKKIFSILFAVVAVFTISATLFESNELTPLKVVGVALGVVGVSMLAAKTDLRGVLQTTVSVDDARGIFTNAVIAVYSERTQVTSFLRSFFPAKFSPTRLVSIAVKRGTEKVAVDVLRGTGSNLVQKTKSTMKTLEPPLYALKSNVNELDTYDIAFSSLDPGVMANLSAEQAEVLLDMTDQIERSYEKQCADVLQSGIITLANHDNIDFKRKAESIVDLGAGNYWTTSNVDPMVALENAGKFLREKGKAQGGVYNAILGGDALNALLNNPIFQNKYDIKNITLGEVREPQRMSTGGTLHGRVTAGAYSFNLWSYPEGYEDANGDFQYYINPINVVVLPEVTNFVTAFGLVPQLPGDNANTSTSGGQYVLREYIDNNHSNHVQEIKSAGVAVPVAIDRIYTFRAVSA